MTLTLSHFDKKQKKNNNNNKFQFKKYNLLILLSGKMKNIKKNQSEQTSTSTLSTLDVVV